ncbi:glutathione S-transferase [Abortiporus biennis]|nr:glutathione S-transferase [Abortiporus biennis]
MILSNLLARSTRNAKMLNDATTYTHRMILTRSLSLTSGHDQRNLRKPFELYTAGTPNGRKVSILLEELKSVYGLDYNVHRIDLSRNVQKEPWFIEMNPNGRIPVLVDNNNNNNHNGNSRKGFAIFESAAILLYLEQHYDFSNQFWFNPNLNPNDYSTMLQWIFFSHGGIGPMQGQANHFVNHTSENIPYAKKRYLDETKRLYGVLEIRLTGREWLAGSGRGIYSIADINAFPWVRGYNYLNIETLDEWPNVKEWLARIEERPAVKAGLEVP